VELTGKSSGSNLRGLLATRQGTFLIALVCAAVAAVILVVAITGYRNGVNGSSTPETVLVANGLIQKGTSGDAIAAGQLYTPTKFIQKNVSTGAVTDAAALRGKVAANDILPGQQLTAADFSSASGPVAQLAPNQRAVSIPLDASHGLSGVLQSGERVDVYGGFNVQTQTGGSGPVMRLLIPNVQVIQASAGGGGGVGSTGNNDVVLAVNDNQAAELAYASDNGKIWLVLRPGGAQNPTQTVATLESILLGRAPISSGTGGKP
jgi:Flp pilus assembly protein CpaB